jgi:hypothetical protein
VLTSLDRLSFQWVDNGNITIDNDECEWNAVVQIQEQVTSPRVGSTIPKPPTKDEIAAQKAASAERERENALLRARSAAGAGSRGK